MAMTSSRSSKRIARVEVVPWSMARIFVGMCCALFLFTSIGLPHHRPQWKVPNLTLRRRCALRIDLQHHAKARLATHHPVISGLRLVEREYLVHRRHVVEQAELKRIF